jgi:hypothetical protein
MDLIVTLTKAILEAMQRLMIVKSQEIFSADAVTDFEENSVGGEQK